MSTLRQVTRKAQPCRIPFITGRTPCSRQDQAVTRPPKQAITRLKNRATQRRSLSILQDPASVYTLLHRHQRFLKRPAYTAEKQEIPNQSYRLSKIFNPTLLSTRAAFLFFLNLTRPISIHYSNNCTDDLQRGLGPRN